MQSSNASSDWDFTAVIDFLHTPTKPTEASIEERSETATLSNGHVSHKEPLSASRTLREAVSENRFENKGLGDFTALWNFLHPSTTTTHSQDDNDSTRKVRNGPSKRTLPPFPRKPISIIKPIAKTNIVNTNTTVSHVTSGVLSDSTGESDGDLSVFDSPSLHKTALSFIPPQVKHVELTPPSSCEEDNTPSFIFCKNDEPIKDVPHYKTAVERKAGLVFKLNKQFRDFSVYATSSSTSPIHVFVDISNISIGMHDSYKIQHGIPVSTSIKRLPLSFHNLSLILERGRPTAKRVLAGSDRFPAINEAENLGYEVNILNRVHKAKKQTPRQMKFHNALGPGRRSEMMASSPERWVEQCVDEILHLKMMESLVDTDEPATIVLATGDAAEAEYSDGFLRMVQRALQKGWTVELVSFAMNTSSAYRKKEFRAKWGAQFQMVNLEDYVEEMLDM